MHCSLLSSGFAARRNDRLMAALGLVALVVAAGCASAPEPRTSADIRDANPEGFRSQIVLLLNGQSRPSNNITLNIASVMLVAENGSEKELLAGPIVINALDIDSRQMLLAERMVPENKYSKLRMKIEKASVKRDDQVADLSVSSDVIEIPVSFATTDGKTSAVFLSWNVDGSIESGFQFRPLFAVRGPAPALRTLMMYVPNERSGNVFVLNRQTDEVVDAIMVGRRPIDVAVNERKDRRKVFVVNAGSNTLTVIDPNSNAVENEVPVRFGKEPSSVAVVSTSPTSEMIVVANYGSNNVSVIDGSSLQELQRIDTGRGPVDVAVDPPLETVLGSRFLSPDDRNAILRYREQFTNVYVANRHSKSVTVIRVQNRNGFCERFAELPVDWDPVSIFADGGRGKIYVVNNASDTLSVISIPQLVRGNVTNAVSAVTNVGHAGVDIIADPNFDRLYFLKESGEISILRVSWESSSAMKAVLPTMMGSIPVGEGPRALVLDPEAMKLYVVNRLANSVEVIDKATRRQEKVIPAGNRPAGIALFQN